MQRSNKRISAHLEQHARGREPRVADAHAVQVPHAPCYTLHDAHQRRPAPAQRRWRQRSPRDRLLQAPAVAELLEEVQRVRRLRVCWRFGAAAARRFHCKRHQQRVARRALARPRRHGGAIVVLAQPVGQRGHHVWVAQALRGADARLGVSDVARAHWRRGDRHAACPPQACTGRIQLSRKLVCLLRAARLHAVRFREHYLCSLLGAMFSA